MSSDIVPEEFIKVVRDFIIDLKNTFPEYNPLINKWWKTKDQFSHIEDEEERINAYKKAESKSVKLLFDFTKKKLPPRIFDILYQNEDMFKEGSEFDTEFFPNIHFKNLWQCEITDKTRETIWKYLQLMLFSIVGTMEDKDAFGDTAKLFEAINEGDFKSKLQDTLSQMQGLFDTKDETGLNQDDLPNAEKINEHITGMLDGKIGKLAREIAEETAADLNMDLDGATDMKDVFNSLIQNPTKLMGLIKNVGDKLDTKLKSGELKETEMLQEATDIMNRMKHMPGMENIQSMLSKMGMGGLGGKINTGAMEAQLNQRMKNAQLKERIRAKAQANAMKKQAASVAERQEPQISEEEIIKIFSSGEKAEKTQRGTKQQFQQNANKKKKGKK